MPGLGHIKIQPRGPVCLASVDLITQNKKSFIKVGIKNNIKAHECVCGWAALVKVTSEITAHLAEDGPICVPLMKSGELAAAVNVTVATQA